MHEITRQVRTMYERHPYPLKPPGVVSDLHPDLMISYLERAPKRRPLQMLDAGCGTGSSSLGTAACNPHWRVTAIDLNRTALAQVRQEAEALGLSNLNVLEVDMLTLEGLQRPPGGFDFILCSGSLPCIADPALALRNLAGLLADDGVMRVMVYNRLGRQGIYRFVQALDCLHADRQAIPERLELGRAILAALRPGAVNGEPWVHPESIDDHEFVDRYLNVHDLSYTIPEFFALVKESGWSFLRWYEPRHWQLDSVLTDPAVCARLADQPPEALWSFIELVAFRPQLDALLVGPKGKARAPLRPHAKELLALSPQLGILEHVVPSYQGLRKLNRLLALRQAEPRPATALETRVLEHLGSAPDPLSGLPEDLRETALAMLDAELLYRLP